MNPKQYYTHKYRHHSHPERRVRDRLSRRTANKIYDSITPYINPEHKYILDVGCGAGEALVTFALHGANMTGITPRDEEIKAAKAWLKQEKLKAQVDKGIGEALPYEDDYFDLVICTQTIEHVQDIDAVLREIYRVLTPEGLLRITAPNNLQPYEGHYKAPWIPFMPRTLAHFYAEFILNRDPYIIDDIHYITRHGIDKKLKTLGFQHVKNFNHGRFYSSLNELYQKDACWGSI